MSSTYAENVVQEIQKILDDYPIKGLRLLDVRLTNRDLAKVVVVLFEHESRSGGRFGMKFSIRDESSTNTPDGPSLVASEVRANIEEEIEAADLRLPRDYVKGGIAWIGSEANAK